MVNSIKKGKAGEREFAWFLRQHGYDARRGVQHKGTPDSPDVIGLPGFHIEVKRVQQLHLYHALKKATEEAGQNTPIIAHRKNREKWVVILDAEDFLKVVKENEDTKDKKLDSTP